MKELTLFINLEVSDIFHFYDTPERKLIKADGHHCITPEGKWKAISPTVLVKKDEAKHERENDKQRP